MELDMRVYLLDVDGDLRDLRVRKAAQPLVCHNDNYAAGRRLARTPRKCGSNGIAYDSVRRIGAGVSPYSDLAFSQTPGRNGTPATFGTDCRSRRSMRSENLATMGRSHDLRDEHVDKLMDSVRAERQTQP